MARGSTLAVYAFPGVLVAIVAIALLFVGATNDLKLKTAPDVCLRLSELPPDPGGGSSLLYDTFVVINGERFLCSDYSWRAD